MSGPRWLIGYMVAADVLMAEISCVTVLMVIVAQIKLFKEPGLLKHFLYLVGNMC